MIAARVADGARLAAGLAARARQLGEAAAEARLRGEGRWRQARLLWPLFARER